MPGDVAASESDRCLEFSLLEQRGRVLLTKIKSETRAVNSFCLRTINYRDDACKITLKG